MVSFFLPNLANLGHRQTVALGARLRRERVLVALGEGRNGRLHLDAVPDNLFGLATWWDFCLTTAGHHGAWAELLFHFDTFRGFQAGGGFGAGWPRCDRSFDSAGDFLLQGVITGKLFRFWRLWTGSPGFGTRCLFATGWRFGHLRRPVLAGLLDTAFLLAEIRQPGVLATFARVWPALGQLLPDR